VAKMTIVKNLDCYRFDFAMEDFSNRRGECFFEW